MKTFKIRNTLIVLLVAVVVFLGLYFFYELGKKYRGYDKQNSTLKTQPKN
jgi:hypothetical protein